MLEWLPISPLQFMFKPAIPLIHRLASYFPGLFHPDNIDPAVSKRMVALAAEVVTSSRIWLEFGRFVETGMFGPPGGHPYLQGLSNAEVPIFIIGGSKDGLAPPEAVAAACESTGTTGERKCTILGKASGCIEEVPDTWTSRPVCMHGRRSSLPSWNGWKITTREIQSGMTPGERIEWSKAMKAGRRRVFYGTGTGIPYGPGNRSQTGGISGSSFDIGPHDGQGR